ncbi:MarR family transcriptional regulator [Altererythrobacter sp. FM1]|uniref:MarR family winged helix-turn-helix transcriptional regulator n=1 Tax=Tsuneonella flava TaxID=2055955 RepID=UPI000C7FA7B6|nr:MarR family transcriptional regulator [Tsuneonella flava]ROT93386.1 MarR family transcriptional regulator [Altererythrobacter sp. FM1]
MEFSKDLSAGYLVNHMARLFEKGLAARIRPLGLTPGTFPALLELWEGDGLTQKDLVERLDIEQATMANTLARMERDGLVRRERDNNDGRVQRIRLTDRAKGLRDAAIEAAMSVNNETMAGLSMEEQHQLVELMQKVIYRDQTSATLA